MKNRLADLNNHLFAQLERLSEEGLTPEQIETEVQRTDAVVSVSDTIIKNAALQVQAVKMIADHGAHLRRDLPMLQSAPEQAPKQIDGRAEGGAS
ncbi:hypothetical protein IWQ49_006446 [Labrenzia sp. EL_126]|nr:hypothetical protein [Labrenzia sp. EL_126]